MLPNHVRIFRSYISNFGVSVASVLIQIVCGLHNLYDNSIQSPIYVIGDTSIAKNLHGVILWVHDIYDDMLRIFFIFSSLISYFNGK